MAGREHGPAPSRKGHCELARQHNLGTAERSWARMAKGLALDLLKQETARSSSTVQRAPAAVSDIWRYRLARGLLAKSIAAFLNALASTGGATELQ